eukprot:CAMPEP_0172784198 /NCGR_PEP_ID=MMETSP1074-20121228/204823_1 /TAXON_ID=2916 /ORGANISM="Ceratium fusus, Strain PA161109" /LENGTH=710 /DNA_ID=CAMNT_0013621201 /DNA_START=139 /DNA_END=2273 /DNA_ORIENTATION=+
MTNEQDSMKQAHKALAAEMSSTKRDLANLEGTMQGMSILADQSSEKVRVMGSQLSNCEKKCHKLENYGATLMESCNDMEKKLAGKEKDADSTLKQLETLKNQMDELCSCTLPAIEAAFRSEFSTLRNEVNSRPLQESELEASILKTPRCVAIGETNQLEEFRRDIEERVYNLEVVAFRSELGSLRSDVEERLRDLEVVSASSEVDALRKDVERRLLNLEERPHVLPAGSQLADEKTLRMEEDLAMVRAEMASLERQFLEGHMDPAVNTRMEIAEERWKATNSKLEILEENLEAAKPKMQTLEVKWEAAIAKVASVELRLEACKDAAPSVGSDDQESSTVLVSSNGAVSEDALEALKQLLENRHREHSSALTVACAKLGACEERCEGLHHCRQSMVERLQGLEEDLSMNRARLASLERVREDGRVSQAELKMDIADIREVMDSQRKELADRHVEWSRHMEAALKLDVAAFKAATDATTKDVEQRHLEWSSIVEEEFAKKELADRHVAWSRDMEAVLTRDVAAFKAATDATTKDVEQRHLEWSSIVEEDLKQSIASVGAELETFKGDVVDKQYDQSLTMAEVQRCIVCVQENTNVLRKMLEDWSSRCAIGIEDDWQVCVQENTNVLRKMLEDWSSRCAIGIEDDCAMSIDSGGPSFGALTAASDKINTVEEFLRDCEKYCSDLDLHCTGVVDRMQDIQLRLTTKGENKIDSF